ncbi:MAG: DUF1232 domain-containing protein [Deltaproteobacteria bacterium]|nr:DUF1232 domain-containing protein [Deltaproteobacteria bacterium]
MRVIDSKKAKKALESIAKKVSEKDLFAVLRRKKEIEERLDSAGAAPGAFQKFVNQVMLLFALLSDYRKGLYREVPWYTVATAVAALVYFLNPVDLVPDFIPILGQLDDALVVALAFRAVQEDLKKYAAAKGFDLKNYF